MSDTSKSTEKSTPAEVPNKTVTLNLVPAPATQVVMCCAGLGSKARAWAWLWWAWACQNVEPGPLTGLGLGLGWLGPGPGLVHREVPSNIPIAQPHIVSPIYCNMTKTNGGHVFLMSAKLS